MTIYVMAGWGKGKTTSSIGITLRALANSEKVLFAQFLKDGQDLGLKMLKEISLTKDLKFVHTAQGMHGFDLTKAREQSVAFRKQVDSHIIETACNSAIENYNLIVLDEINTAQDYHMLDLTDEEFVLWIQQLEKLGDVYVTGRINRGELRHRLILTADIATDCYCEAHSYNKKCDTCEMEFTQHYMFCPICGSMLTKGHKMRKGREC